MTVQRGYEELVHRHPNNPILTAAAWPYAAHSVFNAGAARRRDGTTLLLCRVEDRRGHSHLCAARSVNAVDGWVIDSAPTLQADPEHYPEELWGIEDPRITYLEEPALLGGRRPPARYERRRARAARDRCRKKAEHARDGVRHVVGTVDAGFDSADVSSRQRAAASGSPVGPASRAVACLRNVITSAPSAS